MKKLNYIVNKSLAYSLKQYFIFFSYYKNNSDKFLIYTKIK